ncbi:hypothetical protein HOB95_02525 [bacterium]|jgi:hypothetical protein|nr:hypothetical protein [bacterium]MBT6130802.1 hypothetical protein [bacterium]
MKKLLILMLTFGCATLAQGVKKKQIPSKTANDFVKCSRSRQNRQGRASRALNNITNLIPPSRCLTPNILSHPVIQNTKQSRQFVQLSVSQPLTLLQRRQGKNCKPLKIITMPTKDLLFGAPNPLTGRPNQEQARKYVKEILGTQYISLDNLKKHERFLYDQCTLPPQKITYTTLIQHIKYHYEKMIENKRRKLKESKQLENIVADLMKKSDQMCQYVNDRLKTEPLSLIYLENHEPFLYNLYTQISPRQSTIAIDNLTKRLEGHYQAKIKSSQLQSSNNLGYKLAKATLQSQYKNAKGKNDRVQALDEYLRIIQNHWIDVSKSKAPQHINDSDHQYIQNVLRTKYITIDDIKQFEPASYAQLVELSEPKEFTKAVQKIFSHIEKKYTKHIHPSKINHNFSRCQNALNCFTEDHKNSSDKINRIQALGRLIRDMQDCWIDVSKYKIPQITRPSQKDAIKYAKETLEVSYITLDDLKTNLLYKACIESKAPHQILSKIRWELNKLYTPNIDPLKVNLNIANYNAIKTRVCNNFFFDPYDKKAKIAARAQAIDGYIQDIQNHWIAVSKCKTPQNTTQSYL